MCSRLYPKARPNFKSSLFNFLKCPFHVGMSVFAFVCVILPTDSLPNCILTPWVASWWKTQSIAAMEASKQTGLEIADSTKPKKPELSAKKLYDQRLIRMDKSTRCVRIVTFHCELCFFPQSGNQRKLRVWGGGGRKNNALQYFEFGLQCQF